MYIYTVFGECMLIQYVKSHVGHLIDSNGLDTYGRIVDVPALLRSGEEKYCRYRGTIDAAECHFFPKVKLIGFTQYSLDEGKTWIRIEENTCVVGAVRWGEFYIMLFDGEPYLLPYIPKLKERYVDNVYHIGTKEKLSKF